MGRKWGGAADYDADRHNHGKAHARADSDLHPVPNSQPAPQHRDFHPDQLAYRNTHGDLYPPPSHAGSDRYPTSAASAANRYATPTAATGEHVRALTPPGYLCTPAAD